ncbi:hypothetical protein MKW94_012036 [Papaver nudicaule]|uniref:Uncharacterized protein n=1 Tax=Papaver nudicaule TaxID=74823 RepID=A0AA42B3U3_PAPNU|nr:hypothetical protein [Papaver nudicaule]
MVIPIDDHMVHRGHGVFDTARIVNGQIFEISVTSKDFISVPSIHPAKHSCATSGSFTVQKRVSEVLAKCWTWRFLVITVWLPYSAFYAIVISDDNNSKCKEGVKVITSTIPMKPPLFATSKNVNYLPNVLSKMLAEEKGAFASVWVVHIGLVVCKYFL